MISVCTVVDKPQDAYYPLFLRSMLERSSGLITNVYVALVSDTAFPEPREWSEQCGNVTITYFDFWTTPHPHWISYKHSLGLHSCLDRVKTKYVMLSDCDLFFIAPDFDEFMLETFQQNDLSILGVEMYKASAWYQFHPCYGKFPSVHNCLLRMDNLPPPEMFAGKLRRITWPLIGFNNERGPIFTENYFLVCGCIPEYHNLYISPDGHYDTGCNLYLWNKLTNGKWLTFYPGWKHVPVSSYESNVRAIVPTCKNAHLLYHQGGLWENNDFETFSYEFHRYFPNTEPR